MAVTHQDCLMLLTLFDWNLLSFTGTVTDNGDRMTSLYWMQISALNCDPWEQLENEIISLLKVSAHSSKMAFLRKQREKHCVNVSLRL